MPDREDDHRILIFDNDAEWMLAAKEVLEERGFVVDIEGESFEKCFEKANLQSYLAAVVNVHSLQHAKDALRRFNIEHPTCGLVLVEEHMDPEIAEWLWPPDPVGHLRFGDKKSHFVTDLPRIVEDFSRLRGMLADDLEVSLPGGIDEILTGFAKTWTGATRLRGGEFSIKVLQQELRIVISQMFHSGSPEHRIAKKIDVQYFGEEAGHSGSSLFKITPVIVLPTERHKSAVLKFGPKAQIQREARNYDRFVEWFLTVEQTVIRVAYAEASNFAGILYTYPKDAEGGYSSFSEFIQTENVESCLKIVSKMFSTENRHWLSVDGAEFVPIEERRFQTYYVKHVLHASLHEMRMSHFRRMGLEIRNLERKLGRAIWDDGESSITFYDVDEKIPNPITYLAKPNISRVQMTICHGDLHGHNILVDDAGRFFLLDFYYTGFGHVFRDFIELELSIRYDLFCSRKLPDDRRLVATDSKQLSVGGLKKLIRLEKALMRLAQGDTEVRDPLFSENTDMAKALSMITEIRRLAAANASDDMRLYYMGLAVSSLKALKYFYPLDVRIYRTLIAGFQVELVDRQE